MFLENMGNDESRFRSKRPNQQEDMSYRYYNEEVVNERQMYETKSSRKRYKESSKRLSRSWSRSPKRAKRTSRPRSSKRARRYSRSSSRSDPRTESTSAPYGKESYVPKGFSKAYYCKLCDTHMNGIASWNQHVIGKRHALNTKSEEKVERHPSVCQKRTPVEAEIDEEKNSYVGLDYVLVIHKHNKSIFQCHLCETSTIFHNAKQLKDHVLGEVHQRAFLEDLNKGSIKIRRLKSRNPGKSSLEESIEQILFKPNRGKTYEKADVKRSLPSNERLHSNHSSSKRNHPTPPVSSMRESQPHNFLRKTLEQVELHNKKYALKMTSTRFCAEKGLENRVSSTINSTASLRNTTSTDCTLSLNNSTPEDTASSSEESTSSPEHCTFLSSKSVKPKLLELMNATTEFLEFFSKNMNNIKFHKVDMAVLDDVVDQLTTLSKKVKMQAPSSTLHEEAKKVPRSTTNVEESIKRSKPSEIKNASLYDGLPSSEQLKELLSIIPNLNLSLVEPEDNDKSGIV